MAAQRGHDGENSASGEGERYTGSGGGHYALLRYTTAVLGDRSVELQ